MQSLYAMFVKFLFALMYKEKFNGKKTFKGFLQGIDENGYILLKTEDYEMKVDFLEIEKANIDADWSIKNNQIL